MTSRNQSHARWALAVAAALVLFAEQSVAQDPPEDPAKATAEGWQRIVDPLTAEVCSELAKRYDTLSDEYIVAIRGAYEARRAGAKVATLNLVWTPPHGVTATFQGKGLEGTAGEALRLALRVVWEDTLMADFSSRTRTARKAENLYVLTEERESAVEKTWVNSEYGILRRSREGKTEEGRLERAYECTESRGLRYLNTLDLKAHAGTAAVRAACTIRYGTRDGFPSIDEVGVELETGGPEGAQRGRDSTFVLALGDLEFTRIEKTGRGLERDRQDAVAALRLATELLAPDPRKRLEAARALGGLGVHGRLALRRLLSAAKSDRDPDVRRAAAATVAGLRRPDAGPGEARVEGVAPLPAGLDPRLVGTWRARYVFRGTQQVETVTFLANGRITSEAVNIFGAPRFRRSGTWSFGNDVLYVKFAGEATAATRLLFQGPRRVSMRINQQQRTYDRIR